MRRLAIFLVAAAVIVAACSSDSDPDASAAADPSPSPPSSATADGGDRDATTGDSSPDPAPPESADDLHRRLIDSLAFGGDLSLVARIGAAGEPTSAWVLTDVMRFTGAGSDLAVEITDALLELGVALEPQSPWKSSIDRLIADDVPAPAGYPELKRRLFTLVDQRWEPLFAEPADLDWRLLTWGGVFIDDRPEGTKSECRLGCIPALDAPAVTDAAGGDWYPDERFVFGVVVDGEARAYPKHIMEVHEMVNDVLGGRRIGVPYCTLCGSAQAYFTDEHEDLVGQHLVLRTSGMLSRSNKVMYDLVTGSVFDTFTGRAVTGSLLASDVGLTQVSVRAATWGDWKAAHPDTTIVAPDGGVGRIYPLDPLAGRDDDGPIFPIGDVDDRLPVQERVVGAIAADGTPVAFSVRALADAGDTVSFAGLTVRSDGAGWVAEDDTGAEVPTHEAFWFAWSQFWPDTEVWVGG